MAKNQSSTKTNSSTSSFKRILKLIKKKPLVMITPLMGVVIIVLAVLLIVSNAPAAGSADAKKVSAEAEEETSAVSYDESKWMMQMSTGYMSYDDEDYVCTTGIDVSEWSLEIDWDKVKAAGIDFVICRVGYRGYGTGKFQFDTNLETYLEGAEAAGINTGVYFVTQAVDEKEAVEEAETVLEKIKDFHITMPVYVDCEANTGEETRTDKLTREQWTENAVAFCKRIEEAGYRAGIYSNNTWIDKHLDMSKLTDYDIWFAKYTNTPDTEIPFNCWQYSASGTIDGITTAADLNVRIEKK